MRRLLTLCAVVAVFSTLAMAESWTGKLVDATCFDQQQTPANPPATPSAASCDASSTTTAFAIVASGKAFKFDDAGNAKAAQAMKSRADRSANPNAPAGSTVTAKVTGTKGSENTVKVDTIEVQ